MHFFFYTITVFLIIYLHLFDTGQGTSSKEVTNRDSGDCVSLVFSEEIDTLTENLYNLYPFEPSISISKSMLSLGHDINAFLSLNSKNDNCILAMLDTLIDRYIKTSRIDYLISIQYLANKSDGYLSDALYTWGIRIVKENFADYYNYIFRYKGETSLSIVFTISLIDEAERNGGWSKLENLIHKEAEDYDKEKRKYLFFLLQLAKDKNYQKIYKLAPDK